MAKEADFSELEKFFQNFNDAYKDFDTFLKQFLLEMALRAVRDIKRNTPADTGALRNMWGIGSQEVVLMNTGGFTDAGKAKVIRDPEQTTVESIDIIGSNVEVVIHNLMSYASFVEYGHRFIDGRWNDGRFMMTVGIDKIQKQMPARFDKAFKAYLQSKGAN